MTRALVVHHDSSIAEREIAVLREAGFTVDACPGPFAAGCPILDGLPCSKAERADVLLYDIGLVPDRLAFRRFIERLRSLYGDKALVISSDDESAPALEGEDHEPGMRETQRGGPSRGVVRISGRPTPEALRLAIEEALGNR